MIIAQRYQHNGSFDTATNFCMTLLHPRITVLQGILCEIIATAILVFMSCAVVDARNSYNPDNAAIKLGIVVTVLCLGFIPYTGCSMNPARSFGPALFNNQWSQHWIYWIGPLTGAIVSSFLYKAAFSCKTKKKTVVFMKNYI
jgi:aquaporin related protein